MTRESRIAKKNKKKFVYFLHQAVSPDERDRARQISIIEIHQKLVRRWKALLIHIEVSGVLNNWFIIVRCTWRMVKMVKIHSLTVWFSHIDWALVRVLFLLFLLFVFICQTSLVIIALMFKINKILWQHMTFWANNSISPDIAGPLMRRDVVAYQMWPGHQLAFTFITRNSSITCTCTPCSTTFLSPYIATDV